MTSTEALKVRALSYEGCLGNCLTRGAIGRSREELERSRGTLRKNLEVGKLLAGSYTVLNVP